MENEEFIGFVQELVENGRLEGMEAGIAKQMIDRGYDSLTSKQKYIFDKAINKYNVKECSQCGCDIPWSERLEASYNGGLCNYCQHLKEKMENE